MTIRPRSPGIAVVGSETVEETIARWRIEYPDLSADMDEAMRVWAINGDAARPAVTAALDRLTTADHDAWWNTAARRGLWVEGIGPFRFHDGKTAEQWIRDLTREANA